MSAHPNSNIPYFDIELDFNDFQNGAKDICLKLRNAWNIKDIKIKDAGDGVNRTLICYVEDHMNDAIVFKIYTTVSDYMWNRDRTKRAMLALNECNLCVPVYAFFKNGNCLAYQKGKKFQFGTQAFITNFKLSRLLVRKLAEFHSNKTIDVCKKYGLENDEIPFKFRIMREMMKRWPETFNDSRFYQLRSKDVLLNELEKLETIAREMNMRIAIVHGDANPSNIIYDEEKGSLVMLDYDTCDYDYEAFDLCNFIIQSGQGLENPDGLDSTKDWQFKILREYLMMKHELGDLPEITDYDVKRFSSQIDKMIMGIYLFYIILFGTFTFVPNFKTHDHSVDFLEMALRWQDCYFKKVDEVMKAEIH